MKVRRTLKILVLLVMVVLGIGEIILWYGIKHVKIDIGVPYVILQYGDSLDRTATATMFGRYDVTKYLRVSGRVNTFQLGKQRLYYECFRQKLVKTIEVVDIQAPKIDLVGAEFYFIEDLDTYEELGYSAMDNVDGNLTSEVEVNTYKSGERSLTIVYSVTDSSGNRAEVTRTVSVALE